MIGRPRRPVISTAVLFIATFRPPKPAPKTTSTAPSAATVVTRAGSMIASDISVAEITVIGALPNREHSCPAIIIVTTAPAEMPSSARPRLPADAPTCALTAGTRTTQLAKRKPSSAKKAVTSHRVRLSWVMKPCAPLPSRGWRDGSVPLPDSTTPPAAVPPHARLASPRRDVARERRSAQQVQLAAQPGRARQPSVGGEQRDVQQFGEGDVGGVVDGQLLSQRPAAREQRSVWGSAQRQLDQVGQRERGSARIQRSGAQSATDHRGCLEVDQFGGRERVSAQPGARAVALGAVVGEGGREHAGVNDEHGPAAEPWWPRRTGSSRPRGHRRGPVSRRPWARWPRRSVG